jgi:hypothetical protein
VRVKNETSDQFFQFVQATVVLEGRKHMIHHCCNEMLKHLSSDELAIRYIPQFREYGIVYQDGGSAIQEIAYCPWCGASLPISLREEWIAELSLHGFEPGQTELPEKFRSEQWWAKKLA